MDLYEAILRTSGKTPEQIISSFDGPEPTEQEVQGWINSYNIISGVEVVVMKSGWIDDGYCLVSWEEKDNEKIREFIYQAEQDSMFGSYANDREGFIEDWDSGEYSPAGSFVFYSNDLEIVEKIKKINNNSQPV